MNNYELAKKIRPYDTGASIKIEESKININAYFKQHKRLPFNKIPRITINKLEKLLDLKEELEPYPKLKIAA
jgi:hypothetical protein